MDKQDLDRLAFAGAELPKGLNYGDTLYFLMLRALYRYAKQTDMPSEQGRREKGKVNEACRKYRLDHESAVSRAEQLKDTCMARAKYRKARNAMPPATALYLPPDVVAALTAADRMAETLDNIPIESTNH